MPSITAKAVDAIALAIRECKPCDVEDLVSEIPGILTAFSDEMKRIVEENRRMKVEIAGMDAQIADLKERVSDDLESVEDGNIIKIELAG